jgi:hypothetical protein
MEGRYLIEGKEKATRVAELLGENPQWQRLDEAAIPSEMTKGDWVVLCGGAEFNVAWHRECMRPNAE